MAQVNMMLYGLNGESAQRPDRHAATIVNLPEPATPAPAPVSAAAGAGATYANWFSYKTADFISENREIYRAIRITRALFPGTQLRFVGDSGLDDQWDPSPKWHASMVSSSSESSMRTDWWRSTTNASSAGRGRNI